MNISQLMPDLVKGLPTAIVALLIGLIAAAIAYRQYRVARAKFKLDLFEKRHAVFLETWAYISKFPDTEWFSARDAMIFRQQVANAKFLFGPDVARFVELVDKKSLERADAFAAMNTRTNSDAERQVGRTAVHATANWAQVEVLLIKDRFAPYLDFSKWR